MTAWKKYGPVRKYMEEKDLFSVSGSRVAVIYDYELQQATALMEDGEVYLPCAFVQTILNRRFYWDQEEEVLSYVLPEGIRRMRPEDRDSGGKKLFVYSPKMHDYSKEGPQLVDIGNGHMVFGNSEEIEKYRKIRFGG